MHITPSIYKKTSIVGSILHHLVGEGNTIELNISQYICFDCVAGKLQ